VSRDYGSSPLGQTVARLLRRAGLPAEFCPFAIDTRATRDGWIGGTLGNPVAPLLRSGLLTRQPEKNLFVASNSYATKLNLNGDGSRVEGVTVSDRKTQTEHQVKGRSVVLAGGGLESVRLAIASGVNDQSGRMGKGVTDHIFCRAYYPVPPELYDQHSPEAAIIRVPAGADRKYQIEIHLPGDNIFTLNERSNWKPERTRDYAAMVRTFGAVRPRSDNFIEVGTSGKPGDYTVHFTYSQEDLALRDQQKSGMEQVRQALGADIAEVEVRLPGQSYHEAGGLPMGSDAATSVVDPFGRFHSVPNLVVVDASAWPTQSPANPYLTITALSRRQASQLLQDLG
jgi:choline dehydrogenase-like flavoprotein